MLENQSIVNPGKIYPESRDSGILYPSNQKDYHTQIKRH